MQTIIIPSNAYVRLSAISWTAALLVTFRALIRLPNGIVTPWTRTLTTGAVTTAVTSNEDFPAGELLSFSAHCMTAALYTVPPYVRVELFYGGVGLGHYIMRIMGSYLLNGCGDGMPQCPPKSALSTDQPSLIMQMPAPGLGAAATLILGQWGTNLLDYVLGRLVCDATVGNRYARVIITRLGGNALSFYNTTALVAGSTTDMHWAAGGTVLTVVAGYHTVPFALVKLDPVDRVTLQCDNMQAGDQWTIRELACAPWLNL
jgi:hypothetical protein